LNRLSRKYRSKWVIFPWKQLSADSMSLNAKEPRMSCIGTAIEKCQNASNLAFENRRFRAVGLLAVTILAVACGLSLSQLIASETAPAANPPAAQVGNQAAGQPSGQQAPGVQSAAQQVGSQAPASAANTSAKASQDTFRPRLPVYYARVVDEKQRQKIYDIQRKYHPQIEALQKQLEELIAKRNAEIEAVLTPQQKAEIEKLRQEAATRRSEKSGTAEGVPPQSGENTSNQ
jgi:hypothetical protein